HPSASRRAEMASVPTSGNCRSRSAVTSLTRSLLIARHSMSDVETPRPSATRFLPLLPLSTGVVLPQMVVPLGLESDEAKAAADAALANEGLLVLVPRVETDGGPTVYAKVGT